MSSERTIAKVLAPIVRQLRQIIGRGVVRLVNDAGGLQLLQVTVQRGEVLDGVERFQEFGFTSVPVDGAEHVMAAVKGDRSHPVVVAVDDRRYRPRNLAAGEAQLYNAFGEHVHLREDGTLAIHARSKVHVTAPAVVADCDTAEINAGTSAAVNTATATVQASASATIDSPATTVTGALTVMGPIVGQAGLAVSGGSGAAAQVTGNLQVNGGDVDAEGISLRTHTHPYSGGTTGAPQ